MLSFLAYATSAAPDWTFLTQAGSVGILAAAVVAFVKGWIVSGTQYREACAQRDKAQDLVFRLADAAQRTIDLAERRISS